MCKLGGTIDALKLLFVIDLFFSYIAAY